MQRNCFCGLGRAVLALMLVASPVFSLAQSVDGKLDAFGFFDNVEGDDTYRQNMTHFGFRLAPQLSITSANGRHTLTGGWDALMEPGMPEVFTDGTPIAYYKYDYQRLRFLFGAFPRTMMQEPLSFYLVCDSMRYYRPSITGFDFLWTADNGYLEAYLDWTSKQQLYAKEQFMVGVSSRFHWGIFQAGLEGYLYHYAHDMAKYDTEQFVHDYVSAHPYVGLSLSKPWLLDTLDVKTGVLLGADRDRAEDSWHVPVGFIGDLKAQKGRITVQETFYTGKSQQHFGQAGFGEYYWGDPYQRSSWFSHTELSYEFLRDKDLSVSTGLMFNVANGGMNWHQLVTLNYTIGQRIKRW